MEMLTCSKCEQQRCRSDFHEAPTKRGVTAHCRSCRAQRDRTRDQFARALKKHGWVCPTCQWPRRRPETAECERCLAAQGLKFCPGCQSVCARFLDFYEKKAVCKDCFRSDLDLCRRP